MNKKRAERTWSLSRSTKQGLMLGQASYNISAKMKAIKSCTQTTA